MIGILLVTVLSFADSAQVYYAEANVSALEAMCHDADDRAASLLCRYRLYPLTEDEQYVENLPGDLENASSTELALLSGLWGFRAARSILPVAIRHGYRADRLMRKAKAQDPDDPFVLLIEGQSLLFRPSIAGGDVSKALSCFRDLRDVVEQRPHCGISRLEAELWIWYSLDRLGDPAAPDVRARLLSSGPPPLYRQFLTDPP